MREQGRAFALIGIVQAVLWPALLGALPAQQPNRRVTVTVAVARNPIQVNDTIVLTARMSPPPEEPTFYRFFVDGQPSGNWQDSPEHKYVPDQAGSHVAHAEVGRRVSGGRGRRGIPVIEAILTSGRVPFEVLPVTAPTPEGPTAPSPTLKLALTSPRVVAGEPASFEVTVEGGGPVPQYVPDAGDGSALPARADRTFTHVYQNPGPFTASVSLPAGIPGNGSSVGVTVEPRPRTSPPPVNLRLQLTSPEVFAGQPASFTVTVDGGGALPAYMLDPGDGSNAQARTETAFTYVYQRRGTYRATVSPMAGTPGASSSVAVRVAAPERVWLYLLGGVSLVLLGYVGARLLSPKQKVRRPQPGSLPMLRAVPDRTPSFDPAKPPGLSVEIHLVRNVTSLHFSPRVRLDPKE